MMIRTTNDHGEAFGAWLLVQAGSETSIGQLAAVAKTDRKFKPA
ncbi:hypothetical protein SAMN05444678_12614 [Sphingomonas sp. YR710]|nr:hypothetical protein SAMN05444678_12614 [Sphingomonas sp. YR710]